MHIGLERSVWTPVAVSYIKLIPMLAALFSVDTKYGRWPVPVTVTEDGFRIGDRAVRYFDAMKELPSWGDLGVDVVVDCTGCNPCW